MLSFLATENLSLLMEVNLYLSWYLNEEIFPTVIKRSVSGTVSRVVSLPRFCPFSVFMPFSISFLIFYSSLLLFSSVILFLSISSAIDTNVVSIFFFWLANLTARVSTCLFSKKFDFRASSSRSFSSSSPAIVLLKVPFFFLIRISCRCTIYYVYKCLWSLIESKSDLWRASCIFRYLRFSSLILLSKSSTGSTFSSYSLSTLSSSSSFLSVYFNRQFKVSCNLITSASSYLSRFSIFYNSVLFSLSKAIFLCSFTAETRSFNWMCAFWSIFSTDLRAGLVDFTPSLQAFFTLLMLCARTSLFCASLVSVWRCVVDSSILSEGGCTSSVLLLTEGVYFLLDD